MRALRTTLVAAAAAALTVTGLTSGISSASTSSAAPAVQAVGDAYMGWHNAPAQPAGPAKTVGTAAVSAAATVTGIDVSKWQGTVDWASYWNSGYRFAYIKATEGTTYQSPTFSAQYTGSYNQGFIRGSYHFALPNSSSGSAQASYFVAHGGGWSADGKTLPGTLDIEFNPYSGNTCYDMSKSALTSWISDFTAKYKSLTGRDAVIYTNTSWWNQCVGSSAFGSTNPLWVANYSSSTPPLPAGWGYYTFHQYTDSPLDKDRFNGSIDRLKALALG